jgi:DNA-binding CsgD family transcriptional regulator
MLKKHILLWENDPFQADVLKLWLCCVPGVGQVSVISSSNQMHTVTGAPQALLVRAALLTETHIADWNKFGKDLRHVAVLGMLKEPPENGDCAVTFLPPGSNSCDVIGALGLGKEARKHLIKPEFKSLTDKERVVVEMSVTGSSMKEIADTLDCTISTVQSHKNRAMVKLGVTNPADLAVAAAAQGWRECPCRKFTQNTLF